MNLFKNIYKYNLLGYLIGWILFCIILGLDILRDYSPPEKGKGDLTWVAYQAIIIIMFIFEIGLISFIQSIIFWLILKFKQLTHNNIKLKFYLISAIIYNSLFYVLFYVWGSLFPPTFFETNYLLCTIITFVFPLILIALIFYLYIQYQKRLTTSLNFLKF